MKKVLQSLGILLSAPVGLVLLYKIGYYYGVLARWLGATNNESTDDIFAIQILGVMLTILSVVFVVGLLLPDDESESEDDED